MKLAVAKSDSFLFFTKNNDAFLVYDLKEPKRIKLDLDHSDVNFKQFDEKSISYYYCNRKKSYIIYLTCLEKGILKIEININLVQEINKYQKVSRIC